MDVGLIAEASSFSPAFPVKENGNRSTKEKSKETHPLWNVDIANLYVQPKYEPQNMRHGNERKKRGREE